jgi:hypothetical protein
MPLNPPYVTILESDEFLENSVIWGAATDPEKEQALFWGRVWIDTNFLCPDLLENPPVISDNVKYANSLLGEDYLDGYLVDISDEIRGKDIKSTSKKAGSVEDSVEYFESYGGVDKQADVKALLKSECTFEGDNAGMQSLKRD